MQNDKVKIQKGEFKKQFKKRLYNFVLNVVKFIDKLPKDQTCTVIINQLLRSITSILANYIEAQSASSRKDYTNFFNHALKSANESKVWLALLRDAGKGDKLQIDRFIVELAEIANILAQSIITLKAKR